MLDLGKAEGCIFKCVVVAMNKDQKRLFSGYAAGFQALIELGAVCEGSGTQRSEVSAGIDLASAAL